MPIFSFIIECFKYATENLVKLKFEAIFRFLQQSVLKL